MNITIKQCIKRQSKKFIGYIKVYNDNSLVYQEFTDTERTSVMDAQKDAMELKEMYLGTVPA